MKYSITGAAAFLLGGLALLNASSAAAVTVTVDTFVDSADPAFQACTAAPNDCSLRGAIIAANVLAGADTIRVPAGAYALTVAGNDDASLVGDLDITSTLTIRGLGAGATIDASGLAGDRAFHVLGAPGLVTLERLTLTGGESTPGAGLRVESGVVTLVNAFVTGNDAMSNEGGGIHNTATLILRGTEVTANVSGNGRGGGIFNGPGASLTTIASRVAGNTAFTDGGGVFNEGTATIRTTTIDGNAAGISGGGIANRKSLTVIQSAITANVASGAAYPLGGGGIWSHSDDAVDTVSVRDSDVSGNAAATAWGGGIFSFVGSLTVSRTTVSANAALFGGGLAAGGTTSVTGSTIESNAAIDDGGGLWIAGGYANLLKSFLMTGSTVQGNSAGDGAGFWVEAASMSTMTVTTSTIAGNATAGFGGGIYFLDNDGVPSPLVLDRTTVSQNAAEAGGGLYLYGALARVLFSMVDSNTASSEGGGIRATDVTLVITASTISRNAVSAGDGGGLYNEDDFVTSRVAVNNSTVSGNSASGVGGGVYTEFSGPVGAATYLFNVTVAANSAGLSGSGVAVNGGLLQARNSIIGQQAVAGDDCATAAGGVVTGIGANLEGAASCGFSLNGLAPGLDILTLNAPGATETHALLAGSPAIDAGPAGGCRGDNNADGIPDFALPTDQRGVARNAVCDLGSYEF